MPFDPETGEWYDEDEYTGPLSPYEQEHGNVPYNPNESPGFAEERGIPMNFGPGVIEDLGEWNGVPRDFTTDFLRRNPGDEHRVIAAWRSNNFGQQEAPERNAMAPMSGLGSLAGFAWPNFSAPRFDYKAPTLEEAMQEPGYEFARREGIRALENAASAKGITRTGGHLKDLIGWGNKFAEQNYSNAFNRSYGMARDTFDRNYKGAWDEFQPKMRAAELTFDDLYRRWRDELNSTTRLAEMGMA